MKNKRWILKKKITVFCSYNYRFYGTHIPKQKFNSIRISVLRDIKKSDKIARIKGIIHLFCIIKMPKIYLNMSKKIVQ